MSHPPRRETSSVRLPVRLASRPTLWVLAGLAVTVGVVLLVIAPWAEPRSAEPWSVPAPSAPAVDDEAVAAAPEARPSDPLPTGVATPAGSDVPVRRRAPGATEPTADDAPHVPPPAERDLRRAIEATERGTRALVQGRIPEAIDHLREATLAHPDHAPAWRALGLANERLDRTPEAVAAYERYLELGGAAPDAVEVRQRLHALRSSR